VALLVVDLSGTILGETGRIWMFLMPLAAVSAAQVVAARPFGAILPLAISQLIVLLAMRGSLNVPG
jgi:hypothetical protein